LLDERQLLAIAIPAANLDQGQNRSLERALAAARVADLNRGRDIVILDLRELTPVFDYFVLVTGGSRRQLHAISEEIEQVLKKDFKDRRLGLEGFADSRWILLDFGDVVVHMFDQETRGYYDLEHLWAGAKRIPFEPASPKVVPDASQSTD
jgi:ribosome-associated protein